MMKRKVTCFKYTNQNSIDKIGNLINYNRVMVKSSNLPTITS